ncbi:FAD-dependent oxidoreductase [Hyphomonas sp.]|jgi:selenide,water dikinase|uniref:FAD-dependent oxidoreductase n=1 Tax=Hyphomonas sp. TaxID=87 RepID=UPI0032D8D19D
MTANLLLIGGGHAHITALRWLQKHPCPDVSLTLVSPRAYAVYSGMVPGFVAGHFSRSEVEIDLARLCTGACADIIHDSIIDLDPIRKRAMGQSGKSYSYDLASIDVGIVSAPPSVPDSKMDLTVKPMSPFVEAWAQVSENLSGGVAIVGGGLGGVELAFAVRHKMRSKGLPDTIPVSLVDQSKILSASSPSLRRALRKRLISAGVHILENTEVRRHHDGQLKWASGGSLTAELVLWTAGGRAHDWLAQSGLKARNGFPVVAASLLSISHPDIFIAGDAASLPDMRVPKAGVYAVRQGPILMQNMIAKSQGAPLQDFTPQKDYLKLVSLGKRAAIAEKWGLTVQLPGLWGLKTWIDRCFVQD